ncbi:hypothetical protein [uncultured Hoeflea sp.]|uniref:hypothetical protein n=1 Tax=uncultured Hoeflea sp. TaxID=538666 RepID=UPI00260B518C|nr:hypothetical protein [uncultured Hoeflea sp.]
MGNRGGPLHDEAGRIVRTHKSKSWIICLTAFKNRRRKLMQPGRYTELFFLDEATALAAGHRPCFECRRKDAQTFAAAMAQGLGLTSSGIGSDTRLRAQAMDGLLHTDRRLPHDHPDRRVEPDQLATLPDGTFVSCNEHYFLVRDGSLLRWRFEGYSPVDGAEIAAMPPFHRLTPAATIAALRSGYAPGLHPSAVLAAGASDPAA